MNYFKKKTLQFLTIVELVSVLYILTFGWSIRNFITITLFNLLIMIGGVMTCRYYLTKGEGIFLTERKLHLKNLINPVGSGILAVFVSIFTSLKLYALASIIPLSAIISSIILLVDEKKAESKAIDEKPYEQFVNSILFVVILVSCVPVMIDVHHYFLSISTTIYIGTIASYFFILMVVFLLLLKKNT